MLNFLTVVHIFAALSVIGFVLLQDSKGGGATGGVFGGNSSSVLGATGAASLLVKITRFCAILFATTSVLMTIYTAKNSKSVIDELGATTSTSAPAAPATNATAPMVPAATNATAPAANPEPNKK